MSAGLEMFFFIFKVIYLFGPIPNITSTLLFQPNDYLTMLVTTYFIRRNKAGTREKVIAKGGYLRPTYLPHQDIKQQV